MLEIIIMFIVYIFLFFLFCCLVNWIEYIFRLGDGFCEFVELSVYEFFFILFMIFWFRVMDFGCLFFYFSFFFCECGLKVLCYNYFYFVVILFDNILFYFLCWFGLFFLMVIFGYWLWGYMFGIS